MVAIIFELSLVVGIAAVLVLLARVVKQPPMIAYLIAGILAGPLFFNVVGANGSTELLQLFARLGVAFLLFIAGLHLDFRLFKEVGKVSAVAGVVQIAATLIVGYIISTALGFGAMPSLYLALALTFSSTVVVVKLLSDKKEIDTLHGRIALGILIIQDFVAALALMALPVLGKGDIGFSDIITQAGAAVGLVIAVFFFATFIFSKVLDYLARSQEVLFLFGIAWALLLATLFDFLGFSLEIGALIAGMSLASSKYTLEIGGKIKPLRDFFVVMFFVFFGSQLAGEITSAFVIKALILSAFVIIGKPLFVMTFLRLAGYQKRTNFLAGSSLAQISEFSLALMLLGFTLGHVNQEIMSLVVLVALITIAVSSYGIHYSHAIFKRIESFLFLFGGKKPEAEREIKNYDIFLFGYHRLGYKILESLKKTKASFVVVDHNPKVIFALGKQGINCLYGDASDSNFLGEIGLEKARIVISTIPDIEANIVINDVLKSCNKEAIFIATTEQPRNALYLYENGADYVIVPHHLGGDFVAQLIGKFKLRKENYKKKGKEHARSLSEKKNGSSFDS